MERWPSVFKSTDKPLLCFYTILNQDTDFCAAQDVSRRENSYFRLHFFTALEIFGRVDSTLNKRTFRECLDAIVKSFTDEDVFESLIEFLTKSVEVRTQYNLPSVPILCMPSSLCFVATIDWQSDGFKRKQM